MIEHLDLDGMRRVLTARAALRLFANVTVSDCWEWQLSTTYDGYGKAKLDNRTWRVHRIVYTVLVRALRRDEILDHQCKNRRCCNPDHMDVVDLATNTRRGWQAIKVTCSHGHDLTEDNTYRNPKTGWRSCATCRQERQQRQKAAA